MARDAPILSPKENQRFARKNFGGFHLAEADGVVAGHVGLDERDAKTQGLPITTFVQPFDEVDRAILEGDGEGFLKVHVREGTDRILGATIVARPAGEMLPELVLAMTHGIGLRKIARTIHAYPTQAEAIRKLGDAYNRTRLTPFLKKLSRTWLAWTR